MPDFDLKWFGDEFVARIEDAVRDGLVEIGTDLAGRSAEEAPVDKGDLRGNATVDVSQAQKMIVRVGYSLPYALRQHEELNYNHPRGGKAKFLEDPYRENTGRYIEYIHHKIAGAIK